MLIQDLYRCISSYIRDYDIVNMCLIYSARNQIRLYLKEIYMPISGTRKIIVNKNFAITKRTKYIIFNKKFNDSITLLQDACVTHLIFGNNFNQSVDNLPHSVTYLQFGIDFNQPVDNLPASLKKLLFDHYFNHPVDKLPPLLTHLILGDRFNKDVNKLPPQLKYLIFRMSDSNKKNLKNHIRHKTYYHSNDEYCYIYSSRPRAELLCSKSLDMLPSKLTHLVLNNTFNYTIDKLPRTVRYLEFGLLFNHSVDNLPHNIRYLEFGFDFNQCVDNLPPNIRYLKFGRSFNQPVFKLPKKLKELSFDYHFNQSVNNLPTKLIKLCLGDSFDRSIDKLPNTLIYLEIRNEAYDFGVSFEEKQLSVERPFYVVSYNFPEALQTLRIEYYCRQNNKWLYKTTKKYGISLLISND